MNDRKNNNSRRGRTRRSILALVALASALALAAPACRCGGDTKGQSAPVSAKVVDKQACTDQDAKGVGSAAWYLDLGALRERYGDEAGAGNEYRRALECTGTTLEVLAAQVGLARIEQAQGNRDAAIRALEAARAKLAEATASPNEEMAASGPTFGVAALPGAREIARRLARLYAEAGRTEDADAIYAAETAKATELHHQNELRLERIAMHAKAGTLAAEVAAWKETMEVGKADEDTLWLLAIGLGGARLRAIGLAGPPEPTSGTEEPDWVALGGVLEKLGELRPDDMRIREALLDAYERAGRVEKAVAVAEMPLPDAGGNQPEVARAQAACPGGLVPHRSTPASVATAERVAWTLQRMGKRDRALQVVEKLASQGGRGEAGIQGLTRAARLLGTLGEPGRAEQVLARAAKAARSAEDRRLIEAERAGLLERDPERVHELVRLYQAWQSSGDPCLRAAGSRRVESLQAYIQSPAAPAPGGDSRSP